MSGVAQRVVAAVESDKIALEEDVSINEEIGRGGLDTTETVWSRSVNEFIGAKWIK